MKIARNFAAISERRGAGGLLRFALVGALAAPLAAAGGGQAAAQVSVPSIAGGLAGARGAATAANVPSPSETLYLRRRADYATEAKMIDAEISILRDRTSALRNFNGAVSKDVDTAAAKARKLERERLEQKRREVAALRRQLQEERSRISDRLEGADAELRTTKHLRDQAKDEELRSDREQWRLREQELQQERDRLRGLLERVSQLAMAMG